MDISIVSFHGKINKMPLRSLFLVSMILFLVFTVFSYTVAKETWTNLDFDTTVKLQDRIPRKLDGIFSVFSFLGSAEVTFSLALILAMVYLFRKKRSNN